MYIYLLQVTGSVTLLCEDIGRGFGANGSWCVDGMTKGGQRSHCRARERLARDAVGAEASRRAQMRVAGTPHHPLAPPGGRCQSRLQCHGRGRKRVDMRHRAESWRWSRAAPRSSASSSRATTLVFTEPKDLLILVPAWFLLLKPLARR